MMASTTKKKNHNYFYTTLGVIAIFLVWLVSSISVNNSLILPSITDTFKALFDILKDVSTYKIILFTFLRVLISLVLGVILGIILGLIAALNPWFNSLIKPSILVMRVTPVVSLILVFLIMFGSVKDTSFAPILIALLMIVPIVFEGVFEGIVNLDKDLVDVGRLDAPNRFSLVIHTYIPLINQEIKTAVIQSIGLGLKVMVMAEYISQSKTSIGRTLLEAKTFLNYDQVFAWTIILILLSVIIEGLSKINFKREENSLE